MGSVRVKNGLAVGFGGMAGALLRAGVYELASSVAALWTVNLLGSFFLGWVAGRFQRKSAPFRLFVSTGLLGSFTTFSAFSAEWFRLIEASFVQGLLFAVGMTVLSAAAAAAGLAAGRKGGA